MFMMFNRESYLIKELIINQITRYSIARKRRRRLKNSGVLKNLMLTLGLLVE
ncbi:MAG: hypothetical protein ACE5J5_00515 [Candidatus Hydrothermarchaeales archaeon]